MKGGCFCSRDFSEGATRGGGREWGLGGGLEGAAQLGLTGRDAEGSSVLGF